jgi:glycosyltransferase involved in cell wall biosynthesis
MAIDVKYFPCIKTNFNPPGKRGFLYIGHSNSRKGTDFLSALKRSLTDYRFGWIGNGLEIRGVYRISKGRPLTPDFMRKIAVDFDFFISPSRADPNPTTILESMAWGFPVVCTPQSGYYETDYRRNIFWNDLERSAEVLKELQFTDEQQIEMMAEKAREIVDKEYTWDRFVGIIYQYLGIK